MKKNGSKMYKVELTPNCLPSKQLQLLLRQPTKESFKLHFTLFRQHKLLQNVLFFFQMNISIYFLLII